MVSRGLLSWGGFWATTPNCYCIWGRGHETLVSGVLVLYSYTLECNYNSGCQCNLVTEATMDDGRASPPFPFSPMTHRFSIADFEQVCSYVCVFVCVFIYDDQYLVMVKPFTHLLFCYFITGGSCYSCFYSGHVPVEPLV